MLHGAGSTVRKLSFTVCRPGLPCQCWPSGTVCPECSEEAWPSWVPSPIEVSMSITVASLITAFFPMVIGPTWMKPACA